MYISWDQNRHHNAINGYAVHTNAFEDLLTMLTGLSGDAVRRRVLIFYRRILTGLSGDDHDNQGDDHDVDGDDSDVLKLVESVPPVCQI